MTDYISRQAAIDALARTAREKFNLSDEFNHYLAGLMDGEMAIRQLPSAQPELKKGKWINYDKKYTLATCSKCNKITMFELWGTKVKFYDYCPNCGAEMRGDK